VVLNKYNTEHMVVIHLYRIHPRRGVVLCYPDITARSPACTNYESTPAPPDMYSTVRRFVCLYDSLSLTRG
jgi:hypothetical protein